jgi:hypothetical protein
MDPGSCEFPPPERLKRKILIREEKEAIVGTELQCIAALKNELNGESARVENTNRQSQEDQNRKNSTVSLLLFLSLFLVKISSSMYIYSYIILSLLMYECLYI